MTQKSTSFAAALLLVATLARAGEKSQFNLFNPTPRDLMREMSTDRPDVTESAYTVDAGHFQLELSLVEFVHDDQDVVSIAPSNLKVGLLNNVDLQIVIEPYIHGEDAEGFAATQLRVKYNIIGNDGGDFALGVMPFVQFPTADDDFGASDKYEGGIIVPASLDLRNEWTIAAMLELDFLRDDANEGYGQSLVHTVSLSRPIAGELGGYVEYVGAANNDLGAGYIAEAGAGVTYGLNENVQLDSGIYFGLSDEADDVRALVGISFRM
jgi:hypothetical protein